MSLIKKRLTAVAVDSFTDYLKARFEEVKLLDLDHDGRKDVDQIMEILDNCGKHAKTALETTDFQKLASGLDQIMGGANLVATAIDGKSLQAAAEEFGKGLNKLAQLGQLAIKEAKEQA